MTKSNHPSSFPSRKLRERMRRDAISTSGIHQKDPHVSGATKWQGGERNRSQVNRQVVSMCGHGMTKGRRRRRRHRTTSMRVVCTWMTVAKGRCMTLHRSQSSTSGKRKPVDRRTNQMIGREGKDHTSSINSALPSELMCKAAAPPPPPPLEHCFRSRRGDSDRT